ncbi:cytochrome D ubiquinol oxidase subunit II [Planobispora takensis]|uniref:Cytochrome D ubiquinol oxidase subunit II n=2 Tax=Planobispora takensis TaxID=1367882 RepID=A0A8J3WPG3_9ACTN|nr:cytochrome D ubiquinol oxidase subunit II [Planobispora takensis]
MVIAITLYACSGLADYGAGLWDLTAGGRERGRRPRALIDAAITPVWEANHVWLIYLIILCWTAFGAAFAPIMTTLFIPLALAALGIVLRAAGFAMRKEAARARARHLAGWLFGIGSILTPFCLGAVLGAIMAGRVPAGATGDEISSWWNATSIVFGLVAVSIGAFAAAVYLIAESRRRGAPHLHGYFRTRAFVSGGAALVLGVAGLIALRADQRQMFDRVVERGWPLLLLSAVALAGAFLLAARGMVRGLRLVAAAGIAALIWAWAVAQYPYLLPFSLTVDAGAAAGVTLDWILVWFAVALLLVIPALALLYVLDQKGDLAEDPATSLPSHDEATG